MKKIILSFIFFLIVFSPSVKAQTEITIPSPSITPIPTPTLINYELPYPGILPGSPLYSLKAIRDRIMEFFISDPLRKSSFYLLQGDKRLAAALTLFDRGDEKLAETTLSKGQNYLEKSLEKAMEAKNSQGNLSEVSAKIRNSSIKQRQEIETLSKKAKGEIQQKLIGDLRRAQLLEKRAGEFKP